MMEGHRFLPLIEQIYEAAVDPVKFRNLTNTIAPAFDSNSSLIFLVDRSHSACTKVPPLAGVPSATADFDEWARTAYIDYYHDRNEWFSRGIKKPVPAIVIGQELVDDRTLLRSESYEDYWRKIEVFHVLGASFQIAGNLTGAIGFHRPRFAKQFGEADRRDMLLILPHLQRALQIQHHLNIALREREAALDVIEGLALGVLLVGRNNRILFANEVAERVLQNGAGISVSHGRLRLQDTTQSALFDRVISEAMETSAGKGTGAGGIIAANTPSGRPLHLLVSPLRNAEAGYGPALPAALVIFSDPAANTVSSGKILARVYGLTPAETRLLSALLAGQKLTDYAANAGISINTAKTQMQHIFHKTGHTRQIDLIRTILSDPALQLSSRNGAIQANGQPAS